LHTDDAKHETDAQQRSHNSAAADHSPVQLAAEPEVVA
jgi:hypothetical protein